MVEKPSGRQVPRTAVPEPSTYEERGWRPNATTRPPTRPTAPPQTPASATPKKD